MFRRRVKAFLMGLAMAGCGSGGGSGTDGALPSRPDVAAAAADGGLVGGCDETSMGEDFCIRNPGPNVGGGTLIARQPPAPFVSCKQ